MKKMTKLWSLVCVLTACQHVGVADETDEPPFQPTGGVQYLARGAAFNATRVVGPNVNLSKRADGSWGGRLLDQPVDVNEYENRIGGVEFTLQVVATPTGQLVTGQWQGESIRFELDQAQIRVRAGAESFTLGAHGPGHYGAAGELALSGDAAQATPPFPQLAFAMIGAFSRARNGTPMGRVQGYGINRIGKTER